jgi:hypothetical protein
MVPLYTGTGLVNRGPQDESCLPRSSSRLLGYGMGTEFSSILDGLLGACGNGIWKPQVAAAADGQEEGDADTDANTQVKYIMSIST